MIQMPSLHRKERLCGKSCKKRSAESFCARMFRSTTDKLTPMEYGHSDEVCISASLVYKGVCVLGCITAQN